jgi:tellurite resistance protein TehA-like permease
VQARECGRFWSHRTKSRSYPWSSRLRAWLAAEIATLEPGSFALVMATGIISNAFFLASYRALSDALFTAALFAYGFLVTLTVLRSVLFRRALWSDLIGPRQVFSFFTFIAGTDVLGMGLILRGLDWIAQPLWVLALICWLVLVYFSFGVLIFLNAAGGGNILRGLWLLAIVGTESLVITGTALAPAFGDVSPTVFVFLHMLWGIGLALYGIYITLFAYRVFLFEIRPEDMVPVSWIVMGAAAITANAGSALIDADSGLPFLHSLRPFIDGITLIIWAWATWWIPLLLLIGVWKHGICRVPLIYTPMLWSLVFPLGMYSVASLRLSLAADLPPLRTLSHAMAWIALAAWLATAAGLAAASRASFRQTGSAEPL